MIKINRTFVVYFLLLITIVVSLAILRSSLVKSNQSVISVPDVRPDPTSAVFLPVVTEADAEVSISEGNTDERSIEYPPTGQVTKTIINYSPNPDWQIYLDPVAKFSVQYPQFFRLSPQTQQGENVIVWNCGLKDPQEKEICSGGYKIRVYNDYKGGSRRIWLTEKYDLYKPYYEDWSLAGVKALLVIEGNPGGSSSLLVAIPNGNKMYVYSANFVAWDPDTKKLPDLSFHKQVLTTFKFVK